MRLAVYRDAELAGGSGCDESCPPLLGWRFKIFVLPGPFAGLSGGVMFWRPRPRLYKAEVIHRRSWQSREAVDLVTLEWAGRFNHRRLLEPIGNIPPA